MTEPGASKLHRAAFSTCWAALLLIVAGGLVTSRDAGLAVPDWPLAYGSLNPPRWWMIENVRTEHAHRILAALVASLTVVVAWLARRHEPRRWVRRLAGFAAFMVLAQAVLGGLRVLELSVDLAMVHGCLAQIYFATLVATATVTSPAWMDRVREGTALPERGSLAWTGAMLIVVLAQLVLGITLRHAGADARPLAANALFFAHVIIAFAAVALSMAVRACFERDGTAQRIRLAGRALPAVVLTQLIFGLGTFFVAETMEFDRQATMLESWLPTVHVATGAAILGLTVTLTLHAGAFRPGVAEQR